MAAISTNEVALHRLWLEIRSLRVGFDDALASALRYAPDSGSAVEDVARRSSLLLVHLDELASGAGTRKTQGEIGVLKRHIDERLRSARRRSIAARSPRRRRERSFA
jgi:hypothetical protein